MKKSQPFKDRKAPDVIYDPELNKYQGKILFPKKLALAKEQLKGVQLPTIKDKP